MRSAGLLSTLFAAGCYGQQGYYFVLGGGGMPLVIERVDPAISPGKAPSNHVHSVVGGNAFAATMDFAQTQKATCATVSPKADKSNYWVGRSVRPTPTEERRTLTYCLDSCVDAKLVLPRSTERNIH